MAYPILQNSTESPLIFFMVQSSDHITGLTGASPTVTISKNGGAFASPSGTVSEIANGFYKVAGNATDSGTLGPIALHATATSGDPCDIVVAYVTTCDPQTNIAQTGDAYGRLGAPAGASIAADIAEIEGETDSILANTDVATSTRATPAQILTTALTESYAALHGVPTLTQAIFEIRSMLCEKSVSSTTLTTNKIDGATQAETFTLNSATAPTAITRAS